MKVKLLLLEGVEKEIENEVESQLGKQEHLSDYEKVVAELGGNEQENNFPKRIYVDVTKYYKMTDFYFKKEDVTGLFMSTNKVRGEGIMVINIIGKDYDCLFDGQIFNELKDFLNN